MYLEQEWCLYWLFSKTKLNIEANFDIKQYWNHPFSTLKTSNPMLKTTIYNKKGRYKPQLFYWFNSAKMLIFVIKSLISIIQLWYTRPFSILKSTISELNIGFKQTIINNSDTDFISVLQPFYHGNIAEFDHWTM